MKVLETERLVLRHLEVADADFIVSLLNEPSFLRYIGDRGVRTVEDAKRYILDVAGKHYEENGFGLYLVEQKSSGESIGICGLVNREGLQDVDIGFAFLHRFWSNGYALESASAVMDYAGETLELPRVVAIVSSDNERSFKLLEKIGLRYERLIRLAENEPEIKLFVPADGGSDEESADEA